MGKYQEQVELAASALKRGDDANWLLARLTFENTLERGNVVSQSDEGRVPLIQWCSDVRVASGRKFSEWNGKLYRQIWRDSGSGHGTDQISWHEAYALARGETQEERDDARALSRARNASPAIKDRILQEIVADPEVGVAAKQAAFQTLAPDPAVVTEAARFGSPTSLALGDLQRRRDILRQEAEERRTKSDPVLSRIDQLEAALDVEQVCARFAADLTAMTERFARDIDQALSRTGPAREQPLFWVRRSLGQARAALDRLQSYAESGRNDLEAFLSEVLGGTH